MIFPGSLDGDRSVMDIIHTDVPVEEVEGLKDTIGGGQVLNDSEGYTRSTNKDNKPMQQEEAVDAAVNGLEE